jgi:hypothetical protein
MSIQQIKYLKKKVLLKKKENKDKNKSQKKDLNSKQTLL